MQLDRVELQLLLLAARSAAWRARADDDERVLRTGAADAYERLATRLEHELVRASADERAAAAGSTAAGFTAAG